MVNTKYDNIFVMKKMIDTTKLLSIADYAKKIGKTTQRVYQLIDAGLVNVVEISGKKFIQID